MIDQWIDLVDDQPPPDDTKRRWTSADTIGGSAHTDMFGSADDAALMRAAIEALDTPDPVDCPEGPRSRQQRHYDIVIDLFRRALADQLGDDVASPTSADVILDATTAAEFVADPDQGRINLEHPPLGPPRNPSTSTPPGTGSSAAAASVPTAPRSGGRWPRPRCATAGSGASSATPTPAPSSTSVGPTAGSRPANAEPWSSGTAAAGSRAVIGSRNGATPTTSSPGKTTAPPTSTTASSCAGAITTSSTTPAGGSNATPTPGPSPPEVPTAENSPEDQAKPADHPKVRPPIYRPRAMGG